MNTYRDIPIETLRALFTLDKETGEVRWSKNEEAPAHRRDRLYAPKRKTNGYFIGRIRGFQVYRHILVWTLANGRWPTKLIGFRDKNPENTHPDNLMER